MFKVLHWTLLLLALEPTILTAAEPGEKSGEPGWTKPEIAEIGRGVWRVRFGQPERFTPNAIRERQPDWDGVARLPSPGGMPFKPEEIACRVTSARTVVYVPCRDGGNPR